MESRDYRQLQLPLPQELRNIIYNQMFEQPSPSATLNLMAVSPSARERLEEDYAGLLLQRCFQPITAFEIRRYAQTNPETFGYFVTDPAVSNLNFVSTNHVIVLPNNKLMIHTYGIDKADSKIRFSQIILPQTQTREEIWRRLEAQPSLLDLATTYEILSHRESCINRLGNYLDHTIHNIIYEKDKSARRQTNSLERLLQLMKLHLDLVDFLDKARMNQYVRDLEIWRRMNILPGPGDYVPKRFSYNNGLYPLFPTLPAGAKPGNKPLGDFFRNLIDHEIDQIDYILFGEDEGYNE